MDSLAALGWTEAWQRALADLRASAGLTDPDLFPARVVLEHGRFLRLATGSEEMLAVPAGRLRHDAERAAELPTVGDWVVARRGAGEDLASVRHVLPRKSRFSRRGAGVRGQEQVVAANIDVVLLMMGLDADYNVRRLERYLAVSFASGARPIVLLNKADLCADVPARRAEVQALAGGAPVLELSLREPEGHAPVLDLLCPGQTVALLGSSGVGKSTLLNRLIGEAVQRTQEVRAHDSRGRHTTTFAQLFRLPGGALAIDTPGMRELQLWEAEAGLESAFDDVEAMAARCRFRDCSHAEEPACAVREALERGELARERFASFSKLREELATAARDVRRGGGRRRRR